ncbi:hypothetical protein M3Y94_00376000 [Aphelenchoides besseyi]|nr:hypothetical protein M3Y94_00376000 [Aphelenchoides besseyi]
MKPLVLMNKKRQIPEVVAKYGQKLNLIWDSGSWMNDDFVEKYLQLTFYNLDSNTKNLLIWDSFRAHFSTATQKNLKKCQMETAILPGGTTGFIQPADVSWNRPFKQSIRQSYEDWIVNEKNRETTKGGNLKAPPTLFVVQWIYDAWKSISEDVIRNSFKVCELESHQMVQKMISSIVSNLTLVYLKDVDFCDQLVNNFNNNRPQQNCPNSCKMQTSKMKSSVITIQKTNF